MSKVFCTIMCKLESSHQVVNHPVRHVAASMIDIAAETFGGRAYIIIINAIATQIRCMHRAQFCLKYCTDVLLCALHLTETAAISAYQHTNILWSPAASMLLMFGIYIWRNILMIPRHAIRSLQCSAGLADPEQAEAKSVLGSC